MSRITSGLMLPLTTADLLANAIIGSVLENLDMESIVQRELLDRSHRQFSVLMCWNDV
jgi:hypothetical protein